MGKKNLEVYRIPNARKKKKAMKIERLGQLYQEVIGEMLLTGIKMQACWSMFNTKMPFLFLRLVQHLDVANPEISDCCSK